MACETWCAKQGVIPTKEDPDSKLDDWAVTVSDFSNYTTGKLLSHLLSGGATTYTPPTELWFSCHSEVSSEAAAGTELSGDGYTRIQVTFEELSSRKWVNDVELNSQMATVQWDPILSVCLYDSQVGGNMLAYGNLSAALIVVENKYLHLDVGNVTVEFFV